MSKDWQDWLLSGLDALITEQKPRRALRHFGRSGASAPPNMAPMLRLNTLLAEVMVERSNDRGHRARQHVRMGRAIVRDFPWYVPAYNLTAFILASDACSAAQPSARTDALALLHAASKVAVHPQTYLLVSSIMLKLNRLTEAAAAFGRAATLGAGKPVTEHVVRAYCDTGDGAMHLLYKGAATLLDTLYGDGMPDSGLVALHSACFAHIPRTQCRPQSGRVAFVTEHLAPGSVLSNAGPFLRRMKDAVVVDVGGATSAIATELRQEARLVPPDRDVLQSLGIGIVVCLDGCTGTMAALTFIERAAPAGAAVVSAVGYAHPVCHPCVHWRLTDRTADPPPLLADADRERQGLRLGATCTVERALYLDPCFLCWEAPEAAAAVPLRGVATREAFVANHNFKKLTGTTLDLYTRVLLACPEATLTLKSTSPASPEQRAYIGAHAGLKPLMDAGRVFIEDAILNGAAYHAFLSRFRVCLDCTPYTGTVTTLEALWMDVAVVTLTGDVHRARVSTSILHAIGHPEWCAADADEYVRIASDLCDAERRQGEVREALAGSCIMDHGAYTQRLRQCLDPETLAVSG